MNKAKIWVPGLLLAALLIIGACSPGGESPDSDGDNIMRVALRAEPAHFDQWAFPSGNLGLISEAFYDGLIVFDNEGNAIPHLAESFEIIAHDEWRFTLRDGIKTHQGNDVDAEFIKRWVDSMWNTDPGSPIGSGWGPVTANVVDRLTFTLHADQQLEAWIRRSALPYHMVWDVDHRDEVGADEFSGMPSGTGPFIFKEWVRGEKIVGVANPDYFLGKPEIDEVHFFFIPESATQMLSLESGEVDMIDHVPAHEVQRLQNDPGLDIVVVQEMRPATLMLNLQDPMMSDIRVRKGLAHAFDRQAMLEAQGALAQPTEGHVHPGVQGYVPGLVYEHDPELAESLLNQAGWTRNDNGRFEKDGRPMSFQVSTARGEFNLDYELAEMVQLQLSEFGVNSNIQVFDPRAYFDWVVSLPKTPDPEFQALTWFFGVRDGVPTHMYRLMYRTDEFYNVGHFSDPRYDELVGIALETQDREERLSAYEEMQHIIHENVIEWVFFTTNIVLGTDSRVKEFSMSPPQNVYWHKVRLE
ncbi:MAG: ABC transporter substrate-binding protein [Thermaerobacterales bacterium]